MQVNPGSLPFNLPANPEDDGPPRRLAGKYPDVPSLEQGYVNLQTMSNQTYQELQSLRAEVERLRSGSAPDPTPDPLEQLREQGFDPEPIEALVNRRLEERLDAAVERKLAPIINSSMARNGVLRSHPEFAEVEDRVLQFAQSNREVLGRFQAMSNGDPVGAMEWLYDRYRESSRGQDVLEQARLTHGGSYGGGSRGNEGGTDEEYDRRLASAYKAWQEGLTDGREYMALRFQQVVPDTQFKPWGSR